MVSFITEHACDHVCVVSRLHGVRTTQLCSKRNRLTHCLKFISLNKEFNFECDNKLTGLRKAVDNNCPTGDGSISDKTCAPGSTVVGYMGGTGEYPTYDNYT